MIPPYHDAIVATILGNIGRMALELLTGLSNREGWYYPFTLSLLALVGIIGLARGRDRRVVVALVAAWLVIGVAAIATLDTAFWHFKRYQMPLVALLFPFAAWGVAFWPRRAQRLGV